MFAEGPGAPSHNNKTDFLTTGDTAVMKSAVTLVLAVTLVAVGCGKSGTLAGGPGGAGGSGGGHPTGRGGSGGAAGSAVGTGGAGGGPGGAAGVAGRATGGAAGGAAGAAAGAAGTAGDAGTTSKDGGGDAALACTTGETRCDSSGRRLRCTSDGSWADDNYVCTVALSGSSDYNTMCALKADGRLACWASGDWANGEAAMMVTGAPVDTWKQISVADDEFAICAVGSAGTISCWSAIPGYSNPRLPAGTFTAVSYSIYGTCALTDTGTPVCFNTLLLPPDFVGPFKQIVTANYFVYGIDQNDGLHVPDIFADAYPAGKYKQVIANNGASCALSEDGAIFCWPEAETQPPPTGDSFLPPPAGNGFLEVAAIYGNNSACAIQADHTVTCWLGNSEIEPLAATPSGTFTHIAGCEAAMCGIRTDGTTVCWEVPGYFDPMVPPAGW
jgi:hypothetical protein